MANCYHPPPPPPAIKKTWIHPWETMQLATVAGRLNSWYTLYRVLYLGQVLLHTRRWSGDERYTVRRLTPPPKKNGEKVKKKKMEKKKWTQHWKWSSLFQSWTVTCRYFEFFERHLRFILYHRRKTSTPSCTKSVAILGLELDTGNFS